MLRYRDAAYQYAQRKSLSKHYEGAAAGYKRVEDITESSALKRSMIWCASVRQKAAEKEVRRREEQAARGSAESQQTLRG